MTWDWTRTLRAVSIGAWGGFFLYLWASGRATTYIGPKTSWVVALGAITLPAVALAYLWGARGHRRAPSVRELGGHGLLVAPILLTLVVPAPSLGALAVENKRAKDVAAPLKPAIDGDIRLHEIAWAADSREYADYSRLTEGTRVDFIGFVSARRTPHGALEVSRFVVGCCAADAAAFSVTVTGAPDIRVDRWVQVKGVLTGKPGKDLKVAAHAVHEVAEPRNPYG